MELDEKHFLLLPGTNSLRENIWKEKVLWRRIVGHLEEQDQNQIYPSVQYEAWASSHLALLSI